MIPVERDDVEAGLVRAARRIPRNLKFSDETKQILADIQREYKTEVFNALRIWRIQNTLKSDKEVEKNSKRKPLPALECRMGRAEFKKAKAKLEKALWLMNPCMQQALNLCYEQFSGILEN